MGVKLPVVAIVGRPNVGKSTLFNRILGRRHAIVHQSEGVTRDRVITPADWAGRDFYLVDTGGYISGSDDAIDSAVRNQSVLAMDSADVILFVVDVQVGPTKEDLEVIRILRRSQKPVILVVNKVDNQERTIDLADFYSLGLPNVMGVSALNGRSVGDLLDEVIKSLPAAGIGLDSAADGSIPLAIVGMPNAGKSSLTNALLGEDRQIVTAVPGTTRDAVDAQFKYYGQTMTLMDTAGLRHRTKLDDSVEYYSALRTQHAIDQAEIVVMIIDAEKGMGNQDQRIMSQVIQEKKGLIVVVNKWDLIEKETNTMRDYQDEMIYQFDTLKHYPILFISALHKRRIQKVLEMIMAVHADYHKKVSTRQLNLFLETVMTKRQPPAVKGKEIKFKFVNQVSAAPPRFVFFSNHPKLIPTEYQRFLENQFRQTFGFQGVPIQLHFHAK